MASPSPVASPEALLERFRRHGEPGAFGAFFDATAPELHRVALALTQDPASAEDALQETYVAALRLLPRFEAGRPVIPWMVALLQRRLQHQRRGAVRRRARVAALASRGGTGAVEAPAHTLDAFDRDAGLHAALDGLEEPYRAVAILRWRHGLEPAEIAHVRGEPPGTTRSLLSRALERLRTRWKGTLPAVLAAPRPSVGLEGVRAAAVRAAARLTPQVSGIATLAAAGAASFGAWAMAGAVVVAIGVGTVLLAGRSPPPPAEAANGDDARAPVEPVPSVMLAGRAPARAPAAVGADQAEVALHAPLAAVALRAKEADPLVVFRDGEIPLEQIPGERFALDVEVVDRHGAPVPFAVLMSNWGEWRSRLGTTDALGRGTYQVPRGTRALEVWGAQPGDGRWFHFVHYHALAEGATATRVVVRMGAQIKGRLVTEDGMPVVNASVRPVPAALGISPVRTDESGQFALNAVDGDEVELRFDGLDLSPGAQNLALPLAGADLLRASLGHVVPGGPPVEVVARPVALDAVLDVRVLAPDGTPEPDALVVVHTGNGLRNALARTDAEGRATFHSLPRWPCAVSVTQRAFEGVRRLWRPLVVNDVRPGGAPLEVRFAEVAALRGRVVDASGKPVVGAWCAAMDGLNFAACFASDGEGRFDVCSNVPAGTRLQVCARWPMESPRQRGVVEKVIAGEGEVTIVIAELGDGATR